jgi:hypothetical protein
MKKLMECHRNRIAFMDVLNELLELNRNRSAYDSVMKELMEFPQEWHL